MNPLPLSNCLGWVFWKLSQSFEAVPSVWPILIPRDSFQTSAIMRQTGLMRSVGGGLSFISDWSDTGQMKHVFMWTLLPDQDWHQVYLDRMPETFTFS